MAEIKPQERPLVTFALFAYNQEKYIREAIEGAFSQTYEPLEIILSDDCSTDSTFEIMQEMASKYSGPHQVIVRRTKSNRGTFNHVLEVFGEMSGDLMILAAGDDISYRGRAEVVIDEWQASGASILYSKYEEITDCGISLGIKESFGDREVTSWFPKLSHQEFNHGATTAYDRSVFQGLSFSKDPIFNEDAVFYFLSTVKKYKVKKILYPLIKYRQSIGSISNDIRLNKSMVDIEYFEKKISWMALSYLALCDYVICFLNNDSDSLKVRRNILSTRRFAYIRYRWINSGLLERIVLLLKCRSWREFRFIAPRVMGIKLFSLVKSVYVKIGSSNKF